MTVVRWDADTVPEAALQTRQAEVVPLLPEGASILEVGSGEGGTFGLVAGSGSLQLGIDISVPLLRHARDRDSRSANVQADARHLPLAGNTFDVAMAQELLEHVPDWQVALEELFRTARQRVVVTVPYRQRLKGRRCPHCGEWTPLYGHLHRFSPETFAPWQVRGRMTLKTIRPPLGWRAYWRKAAAWFSRKRGTGKQEVMLRCPGCAAFFPQGLRWQRVTDRLWRLLTRKPEWLLVVWEIGKQ